jgi:RNA polymerase sigma-70 factor (ECF subfamily)
MMLPVNVADAVQRHLATLGVADASASKACLTWVQARTKGQGAEAAVGDLVLVWGVLQGQAAAVVEIDELIESLSRRAAGRAIEASELAQRTRTRLLVAPKGKEARLGTYDGRGKLKSWLWTAIKLELLQATRGLSQAPAEDVDELTHLAASDPSPEARARSNKDTKFVSNALREALEVIDAKERTLLRMRFVDGVSTEELGRMFQVHRTTAQRWIEAAQAKIMTAMRARLEADAKLAKGEVDSLVREVAQSISLRLSQVLQKVKL